MSELIIKPASECRWDCAAFGEVMLRFDPGFGRVRNARSFQVWEGGGEYNVARGLKRTFGKRAAVVTAIVDNPVGRLLDDAAEALLAFGKRPFCLAAFHNVAPFAQGTIGNAGHV